VMGVFDCGVGGFFSIDYFTRSAWELDAKRQAIPNRQTHFSEDGIRGF
jgi:hypothetical protein